MFKGKMTTLSTALKKKLFPNLETFPSPYKEFKNSGVIRIIFPEFTCLCPKTGYPDFARIHLYYLPDKKCIELKSWKLYLNSFRMTGTFHEAVASHLFNTINELLEPKWSMIIGEFLPRGNVSTTVVFESETTRPKGADILLPNTGEK